MRRLKEKGCNVYDFQMIEDVVLNLDNYKDITHYSPQINEWMVSNFSAKMLLCDENNVTENNNKIMQMVKEFKKNNKQLFEN